MSITHNIFTIAQKEFTDNLYGSRFRAMLGVIMLIVLSQSIAIAQITLDDSSYFFQDAVSGIFYIMSLYSPLLGIALGYDVISREKVSFSLNTLLTHPVFRDSIILGKMAGGFITLAFAVILSILCSVGIILAMSGIEITVPELNQIIVFSFITLIYLSVFFALGVLFSTVFSSSGKSFLFSMMCWIIFILMFSSITSFIASMATGDSIYAEDNENSWVVYNDLQYLSPANHYSQLVMGYGLSGDSTDQVTSQGLFDPDHTLGDWMKDYWTNLLELAIMPVFILIGSILVFMKKDIAR